LLAQAVLLFIQAVLLPLVVWAHHLLSQDLPLQRGVVILMVMVEAHLAQLQVFLVDQLMMHMRAVVVAVLALLALLVVLFLMDLIIKFMGAMGALVLSGQ
jgi:hypothetical protein